jgi:hypothetical protein
MEFCVYGIKLRLLPDDIIERYGKARGQKGVAMSWMPISVSNGRTSIVDDKKIYHSISYYRLLWYAHHPEWDFYNKKENIIIKDEFNKSRSIDNMRIRTHQELALNRKGHCATGVYLKSNGLYGVKIRLDGRYKYFKDENYTTQGDAHQAYLNKKKIIVDELNNKN